MLVERRFLHGSFKSVVEEPNYGGLFILGEKTTLEFVKKSIENKCPTPIMLLTYVLSVDYDPSNGRKMCEVARKIEDHLWSCGSCAKKEELLRDNNILKVILGL